MTAKQVRWCVTIDVVRTIGLLCFVISTAMALKGKFDTFTVYEGWSIFLYTIYVVNRYKAYCAKKEREMLGCYENSK